MATRSPRSRPGASRSPTERLSLVVGEAAAERQKRRAPRRTVEQGPNPLESQTRSRRGASLAPRRARGILARELCDLLALLRRRSIPRSVDGDDAQFARVVATVALEAALAGAGEHLREVDVRASTLTDTAVARPVTSTPDLEPSTLIVSSPSVPLTTTLSMTPSAAL